LGMQTTMWNIFKEDNPPIPLFYRCLSTPLCCNSARLRGLQLAFATIPRFQPPLLANLVQDPPLLSYLSLTTAVYRSGGPVRVNGSTHPDLDADACARLRVAMRQFVQSSGALCGVTNCSSRIWCCKLLSLSPLPSPVSPLSLHTPWREGETESVKYTHTRTVSLMLGAGDHAYALVLPVVSPAVGGSSGTGHQDAPGCGGLWPKWHEDLPPPFHLSHHNLALSARSLTRWPSAACGIGSPFGSLGHRRCGSAVRRAPGLADVVA